MDLIKVGKLIAQIRKEKNMTQDQLADKFGISGRSVSKWERGINAPDISILEDLSEELGISVNELLCGEKITDGKKLNNGIIVDNIKYYYNKSKYKYLSVVLLIVIILLIIFSLIFTFSNYNKFSIYSISNADNTLMVDGFIIFNQLEKIIIINDIKYNDVNEKTDNELMAKNVNIRLLSENKVIFYLYDDQYSDYNSLSSILDSISLSITDKNEDSQDLITKKDINNLYLIVEYDDKDNNRNKFNFKIKCNQKFSSNKLFY